MVLLDWDSRGKRCNGKMWTLKYSKKYWKNKGNKYKHCKERQLRNVAMTGWHRQLCPRKQLQDQQNYGPLFIWCSSRFPPSPAGIHPTQVAPRAIPHCRRKSTAFPSAPGHMHTLSPQLCPWILQPKHAKLHFMSRGQISYALLGWTCGYWASLTYFVREICGNGQTLAEMRISEEILFCFN